MADRMHSYPLFSQNLTPNSLQQPQIPQQPPQSQQPDPQMISALSNPEHARMWQQMNQLQNQYRPQQSGDLAASQMSHQMQEFARGQVLSHGQGQPIVQQIQQSFGFNAQRMNPGPVFHDPQANQHQSLMPSNFPNMSMNAQQHMKATFGMNPMMPPSLNNPGAPRQLKLLGQPDMARLQQQGLGAQHAPNQPTAMDMFASSSMQPSQDQMHGSPHPSAQPVGQSGANQGIVPGNQPNVQKRIVTPAEFQERRTYLQSMIIQSDNNLRSFLQTARGSIDPNIHQKMNQLRTELDNRKEMYSKFVATYGAMMTQQMANGIPPNMPHINPMTHTTSQQPPQTSVPNASQPNFVPQTNPRVSAPYNIPSNNGPSPIPTNQPSLNQQIPTQSTQIVRPNTRTGGSPHQMNGGQLPGTPNLGNFTTQDGQKAPNQTRQTMVMPLDKQRFDSTYSQFCRSQNLSMSSGLRVPIGDNRMVDLHQLHVYVMHENGAQSVTQRDMWAVIGGRLGFIQFPGNDTEPARSGPGIAQQLQNTYEQYLQHFEHAYVLTVKNRAPQVGSPQQPMHHPNSNPLALAPSPAPVPPGNPLEMPPNAPRSVFNSQLVATAARYAHTSAQDMRNQGVHEHMITFVERHRSDLVKVYQNQLQNMLKRNAEQEQQNLANAQGPLSNVQEQPNMCLQPGVQHKPLQGVGGSTMVAMPSGDTKMVNGPFGPDATPQKPGESQNHVQHAMNTIIQLKTVFQQRSLHGMSTQQIPDDQRLEYNQLLEQVYKMTSELDTKLHMYFVVFKNEDLLRKYVAIVLTVARQRQLVSTSSPQYIINLVTLRNMQGQIHKLNDEFENRLRAMKMSALANSSQPRPGPPSAPHTVPPNSNGRRVTMNHPQPPPSLPPPSLTPLQPNPTSQPPPVAQVIKKPPQTSSPSTLSVSATVASPTPPPVAGSSSTPVTSAPTPQTVAGSPQTPKSPPLKAVPKKTVTRPSRRLSAAGKGPATPEATPSVAGIKRPPEDDVATFTSVPPPETEVSNAPSPKKVKTEWEGETSEALVRRQQEIESIKTEDDATAFMDRMKELFAMTASTDEIHHDIASTLGQILAGVAQEPGDAAATAAALSVHGAGDAGPPPTALSPHLGPSNDAFLEFVDFSTFTTLEDDDNDSKAPTPDLVHSSETNPSPESGSEGDLGITGSPDKTKIEEAGDRSDPLRLGSLREIDGGESAYYQAGDWKWEGPMLTLDQPWAIFTS